MINLVSQIVGFCAGILSAMGLGGGGILIIYLTLFAEIDQTQAQGINLIFFTVISLISVISFYMKKLINLRLIFPAILFGIPGSLLGFYFSSIINPHILSKMFGVMLIFVGFAQLFNKNNRNHK